MTTAILTMAYNEPLFLPMWRRYYSRAVGEENLFVIDHGSDDGSTSDLGRVQRIRLQRPTKGFDEDERALLVSRFHCSLLTVYQTVIYTDVDEFLVPDPAKYTGLADFLRANQAPVINPVGLEVHHVTSTEADLDLRKPVLSQRRYVQFSSQYCKPLISRVPILWGVGFHSSHHGAPVISRDLYLFHLKLMDCQLALERHRRHSKLTWSENALSKGHSWHQRLNETEFLRRMFPLSAAEAERAHTSPFDFSDDIKRTERGESFMGRVVAVPERFRDVL